MSQHSIVDQIRKTLVAINRTKTLVQPFSNGSGNILHLASLIGHVFSDIDPASLGNTSKSLFTELNHLEVLPDGADDDLLSEANREYDTIQAKLASFEQSLVKLRSHFDGTQTLGSTEMYNAAITAFDSNRTIRGATQAMNERANNAALGCVTGSRA